MTTAPLTLPATGRACAKAILVGEHFVVHGGRALVVPLAGLGTEVRLGVGPPPSGHLAVCLAEGCCALGLRAHAFGGATAASRIPPGAGLGSSAALAVATVRALATAADTPVSDALIRTAAHACEVQVHGQPSGVDVAGVLARGVTAFVRHGAPVPCPVAPGTALVVLFAGSRRAGTGAVVSRVAALRAARPDRYERLHAAAAKVADGAANALARGDALTLGALLTENHRILQALGVSSPALDAAVQTAHAAGAAGAKLTGAGAGGAVLAVVPTAACDAFVARLGALGGRLIAVVPDLALLGASAR